MTVSGELDICHESQLLFGRLLANDLTQQDRQRVLLHVKGCSECAAVLVARKRDRNETAAISQENESGVLMKLAWVLIITSGVVIAGFFLWDLAAALWTDQSQPVWLRAALAIFYVGFVVLFIVILRQRLMARKTDKFRKVSQ